MAREALNRQSSANGFFLSTEEQGLQERSRPGHLSELPDINGEIFLEQETEENDRTKALSCLLASK